MGHVCEGCVGGLEFWGCGCETRHVYKEFESCTASPKHKCHEVSKVSCSNPGGPGCNEHDGKDGLVISSHEKVEDRRIPCPLCGPPGLCLNGHCSCRTSEEKLTTSRLWREGLAWYKQRNQVLSKLVCSEGNRREIILCDCGCQRVWDRLVKPSSWQVNVLTSPMVLSQVTFGIYTYQAHSLLSSNSHLFYKSLAAIYFCCGVSC